MRESGCLRRLERTVDIRSLTNLKKGLLLVIMSYKGMDFRLIFKSSFEEIKTVALPFFLYV